MLTIDNDGAKKNTRVGRFRDSEDAQQLLISVLRNIHHNTFL